MATSRAIGAASVPLIAPAAYIVLTGAGTGVVEGVAMRVGEVVAGRRNPSEILTLRGVLTDALGTALSITIHAAQIRLASSKSAVERQALQRRIQEAEDAQRQLANTRINTTAPATNPPTNTIPATATPNTVPQRSTAPPTTIPSEPTSASKVSTDQGQLFDPDTHETWNGPNGSAATGTTGRLGNLIEVAVDDPAAEALARRLAGRPSVRFAGDPAGREFDVVSDQYVAQTKPANFQLGSKFRAQARATFEAAIETGRTPYFHFEGAPHPDVLTKLKEYGARYGIDPIIDLTPLG